MGAEWTGAEPASRGRAFVSPMEDTAASCSGAVDSCHSLPLCWQGGPEMKSGSDLFACIRTGRERRVALNCAGVITESDGSTVDVTIVDVSKDGFRLRSVEDLELGTTITLQMQETRPVRCEIRWACGHEAGGVFLDPIAV